MRFVKIRIALPDASAPYTNYTGSVTKPPLEAPFQARAWEE